MQKIDITSRSCLILGSTYLSIECAKILLKNDWEIVYFVTEDENVINWCKKNKITSIGYKKFLKSKVSCDYLFSIINDRVIKFETIQAHVKNLAINYHDSPLPRYAGLNSTTWAILNDEKEHGVTWHVMSEGIDEGDILRQAKFLLDSNTTAFSLNLKCTEYAISEFKEIIKEIHLGKLARIPQDLSKRTYYGTAKIPDSFGIIDFNWDIKTCSRVARALTFGKYPNTVVALKIFLQGNFYLLDQYTFVSESNNSSTGEIVSAKADGLTIALQDGLIIIKSLLDLNGKHVHLANFACQKNNIVPALTAENLIFFSELHKNESKIIVELRRYQQPLELTKSLVNIKKRNINLSKNPVNEYLSIANIIIFFIRTLFGDDSFSVNFIDSRHPLDDPISQLISFSSVKTFDENINKTTVSELENKIKLIYENEIGYLKEIFYRYHIKPINKLKSIGIYLLSNSEINNIVPKYGLNFFVTKERIEISTLVKLPKGYFSSIYTCLKNQLRKSDRTLFSKIKEMDIIPAKMVNKIIYKWNDNRVHYPLDKTITELFEEQAKKTPLHIALSFNNIHITYEELNQKSNQLAHFIRDSYKKRFGTEMPENTLYCICVERSIEMIIGLLAILKSGAAYIPLDPSYPQNRLSFILEDTNSKLLLTQEKLLKKMPFLIAEEREAICLDSDWELIANSSTENLDHHSSANDLTYIIYTSGSTGFPKGVMIQHRAIINTIYNQIQLLLIDEKSKVLQFASLSFDASVWEIYSTLLVGATLVVGSKEQLLPGEMLATVIQQQKISIITLPPTALRVMPNISYPSLKTIVVAGEACPLELIKIWAKKVLFINAYGPTEASVCASLAACNTQDNIVTIGKPIANVQLYVCDIYLNPLPPGIIGELYIGGAGLSQGYLNLPELSHERFIPNPFATEEDKVQGYARLYKTGDLVRWLPDGNLEYIGRNDFQVKIRGYRIELSEIENDLNEYPDINQSTVLAKEREGRKYLVAYYVSEKPINDEILLEYLAKELPEYMIPSAFVHLFTLPLTSSGKIDRNALPDPEFKSTVNYVAPRSELEKQIAEVWKQILHIDQVSIEDDFFRLGGDSILSIQLTSRLRQLDLHVSVKDIFEYRTIANLVQHVSMEQARVIIAEQDILTGSFDLLPIQQWFFNQHFAKPEHWNQSFLIKTPQLTEEQITTMIAQLVERHDALRLTFHAQPDGHHFQTYQEKIPLPELKIADHHQFNEEALYTLFTQWQSDFNLEQGPLWQIGYIHGYSDGSARLYLALHHLIVDTVSWRILTDDLKTLFTEGTLGEKTSSYRQWVAAVKEYAQQHAAEISYWENLIEGQPDYTDHPNLSTERHIDEIELSEKHTKALLQQANQAYHTEINDLLLTALAYALQDWHGNAQSYVALEGHGREPINEVIDLGRTVGWFTTMYPIKLVLQSGLAGSIKHIKEHLRTIPHKGIGYSALKYYGESTILSSHAVPAISFNYLGQFAGTAEENWIVVNESSGQSMHPSNPDKNVININGLIIADKLRFTIASQLSVQERTLFHQAFQHYLEQIITHCVEQVQENQITYTPSDFSTVNISMGLVEKLQNRYAIEAIYPANSLQQGFIYYAITYPEDDAYRVQILWDYQNQINAEKLRQAWQYVIKIYPVLRTCFNWEEELIQVITQSEMLSWTEHDIRTAHDKDKAIEYIRQQDRQQAFDLAKPGLFRLHLIQHSENYYTFIFSAHHSILDGWSHPLLLERVHSIYQKLLQDKPVAVTEETAYFSAQIYYYQHQSEVTTYWQNQIKEATNVNDLNALLDVPTDLDHIREIQQSKQTDLTVTDTLYQSLKELSRSEGITLNVLVQFAWHKLIHAYTRDETTIVGTTVSGRSIPVAGVEESVGLYINTLPLIINWEDKTTTRTQLQHIHRRITELNNHGYIDLASLQTGGNRLFHSLFVFENYPIPEQAGEGLNIKLRDSVEKLDYPLSILVYEQQGLHIKLKYAGEYLSENQANRILTQIRLILAQIPERIQQPHTEIRLLGSEEYQQIIYDWNQTDREYPHDKTLHQLFTEQVKRTPDKTALVYEDKCLSYRELDQKANQLARYIRAVYRQQTNTELAPDTLVAMCVERSLDMIIGILGILKAGAAYVPIDPDYPTERSNFIATDTQAVVLLTQAHLVEKVKSYFTHQLIILDQDNYQVEDSIDVPPNSQADHLAYVIYTSGTTGKPKGVLQTHANVGRLFSVTEDYFNFTDQDIWTLFHSYVFDFSVWELWGALLYGGKLVIPTYSTTRDFADFYQLCKDQHVTVLNQTPSAFYQFISVASAPLDSLRYIIFGGEALNPARLRNWWNSLKIDRTKLINMYGITETTVHVTLKEISPHEQSSQSNIGKALNDLKVYVLNNQLLPVPIGVVGELYIGGAGLARGYLNRPELTQERFIPNPFVTEGDKAQGYNRLYKTGDLGRWLPDGNLEYIGRNDFQVKIRGYRIELSEIENDLNEYPAIKHSVVLAKEREGSKYLVAYYVSEKPISDECLIEHLAKELPDYMIPKAFVHLHKLPLTINGKTDRKALPDPEFKSITNYVAPRSELEKQIAEVWKQVLHIDQVSIEDDFFRLGGDSILSIQLTSRLRNLDLHVSVKDIFEYRTIANLVQHVSMEQARVIIAEQDILTGSFDLLPIQQWFFAQDLVNPGHWNQSFLIKVPLLKEEQIIKMIAQLVERHDALRLTFQAQQDGHHFQTYQEKIRLPELKIADHHQFNEQALYTLLTQWQSDFNLDQGPLWQIGYIHGYADGSARLYLALHHLIVDTVSWRILTDDLKTLFTGGTLGEKTSSYRQWVAAVKEYAQQHAVEINYWENLIQDQPDYTHHPNLSIERHVDEIELSEKHTKALLQQANQAYHTEINDLLLTALAYALQDWHGDAQSYVTLEGHGREPINEVLDLSHTVGWFTTMYPIKLLLQSQLATSIQYIKEQLRAIPHKGIGYGALKYYGESAILSGHTVPAISFNYLGQFAGTAEENWIVVNESSGQSMHPSNPDQNVININGLIIADKLRFTIASQLSVQERALFHQSFQHHLEQIISHCLAQVQNQRFIYTPSDFNTVKVSMGLLDQLQNRYVIEAIYPANSLQKGFIYHAITFPQDDAYRVQILWDYHNQINAEKLRQAWQYAVQIYPALRTCFNWEEELIQITTQSETLSWTEHDISTINDKNKEVESIQRQDRKQAFDLTKPGLFRLHLIRHNEDYYTFMFSAHHCILDGWSNPVLLQMVHSIYQQLLQGKSVSVTEEKAYFSTQAYYYQHQSEVKKYWKTQIQAATSVNDLNMLLDAPTDLDHIREIQQLKQIDLTMSDSLYQNLRELSRNEGITLNVLVQFAWHKLIHAYTRDETTIVGTTVSGRSIPVAGVEESVGLYINTLPLIINWEDRTIQEQLHYIHRCITELNNHGYIDLASLQTGGTRLFHSLFVFENYPIPEETQDGLNIKLRTSVEKLDYPFSVIVYEQQGLHIQLKYAGEYLSENRAKKIIAEIELILGQISEQFHQSHTQIRLLGPEEYQQVIYDWNRTDREYPHNKTLHQLFSEQVKRTPDKTALVFEDKSMSYRELDQKSNQLARYIRAMYQQQEKADLAANTLIAICMERSLDMIIGILGILKAGAAYVPIDPHYPEERIHYILQETHAPIILTQNHIKNKLALTKKHELIQMVTLDTLPYLNQDASNLPDFVDAEHLVYVIYTSGTTGHPKGVMIEHHSVVSLVKNNGFLDIGEDEVFLQLSSPVFDAATFEIWGALMNAATLIIPPSGLNILNNVDKFKFYIENHRVSILWLTKTLFDALFSIEKDIFNHLKCLLVGGEALNSELINLLCSRSAKPRYILNGYGPTEATTFSTIYSCVRDDYRNIPIGKPFNNRKAYVVDPSGNPVPVGAIGELYVGGAGIARGYLNRPELTHERFIPNPFATEEDKAQGYTRLYKTGDLVRWLPDGNLEYIGRNDFQVKIRGYRIELSEIESDLNEYPAIKYSVVLAKEREGSKYLVAYYVSEKSISDERLLEHLAKKLPDYMIPSVYVHLLALPLTISGKIDRHALPDPEFKSTINYVAPRNELERQIAEVWQQVLHIDSVSIEDDFFRLGGDSILSIQLASRLRHLDLHMNVKDIFEYRTIANLVQHVAMKQAQVIVAEQGILSGNFDLLPIQQWFFSQHFSKSEHWNQSFLIKIPPLTEEKITTMIAQLADRHDALRLTFKSQQAGHHLQTYQEKIHLPELKIADYHQFAEETLYALFTQWQSNFNLQQGPLWQIGYIHGYADGSARLYLALHHLIVDAVSWRILTDDLKTLSMGGKLGEKSSSYRQWVATVKDYAQQHAAETSYWENLIQGQPDYTHHPHLSTTEHHTDEIELSEIHTKALLQQANQAYHTEINDLLLTALAYALQDWHGNMQSYVTLEGHGRELINEVIDLSHTIGWFTTMYPIRLLLQSNLSTSIKYIKEQLHSIPHKGIGYGALKYYGESSILAHHELPAISFNYLGQFAGTVDENWIIVNESSGQSAHPSNRDHNVININGLIIADKLRFTISSQLSAQERVLFRQAFQHHLKEVITHCIEQVQNQRLVYTPSDFNTVNISMGLLDKLQNRYAIEAIYPANGLQQGFIYHAITYPEDDAYRVQVLWDYQDRINAAKLRQAWQYAMRTYPVLRACFNWEEELIQIITKSDQLWWTEHDIRNLSDKDRAVEDIRQQDRQQAFDLTQPGLFRLHLIQHSENYYTFILSSHHSILDGWSYPLLLERVHSIYQQLLQDQAITLVEETAYLTAQTYYYQHRSEVKKYWQTEIQAVTNINDLNALLDVPADLDNIREIHQPQQAEITIPNSLYKALKELCYSEGISLNILVQFAWHKLIQIYTRDETTSVGTILSGRSILIPGIEESVGLYIYTVPLTIDWEDRTIQAQLRYLHRSIGKLRYIDLASLQAGGRRLFHSLFVFENYPISEQTTQGLNIKLRKSVEKLDYPLSIVAYERQGLHIQLKYAGEYLNENSANKILAQMNLILAQISENIYQSHTAIHLLSPGEYQQIMYAWNKTDQEYPRNKTIAQLFEEQVSRTSEKTAVVYEDKTLNYDELNQKSNQLARYIRAAYQQQTQTELQPNTLIAICVDRGLDMIIGILAILKAGGAYVPIDPKFPSERIHYILTDTQTKLILTQSHLLERLPLGAKLLPQDAVQTIFLDQAIYQNEEFVNLIPHSTARDLAYVIYTSGTTGHPKGVMIEHFAACNTIYAMNNVYAVNESMNKISAYAAYIFDVSVSEFFAALLQGAELHILSEAVRNDVGLLSHYLNDCRINYAFLPPIILSVLPRKKYPALNRIIFAGEPCDQAVGRYWASQYSLFNYYGPTEASIYAVGTQVLLNNVNIIGKPIQNTRTYILSPSLQPVPVGIVGELYIGGEGVARGYLNRPELTQEKFISNPFATMEDQARGYNRLYKTGDLVRWLADGNIEYIGRNDFQVKIRGYRIELGEIESDLNNYPGINHSVVLAKEREGSKYLVAYYVAKKPISNERLHEHLAKELPDYMIPNAFVHLSAFPLTINGKLDRKALPDPEFKSTVSYVAPRNELEKQIAEAWQQVLRLKQVSIQDDFFRLGGDSILSIQLTSRLRQLGLSVSVKDIFEQKTVEKLHDKIAAESGSVSDIAHAVLSENGVLGGEVEFLPIQEWFFDQVSSGLLKQPGHWNQSFLIKAGALNQELLKHSLIKLIEYHDCFRLNYTIIDHNHYIQFYNLPINYDALDLLYLNINQLTNEEHIEILTNWQSNFELLGSSPLFQIGYLDGYEDGSSRIFFALHHLLVDVVSWRIIVHDLHELYSKLSQAHANNNLDNILSQSSEELLGRKGTSYRQWVGLVKEYAQRNQQEKIYWQTQLTDLELSEKTLLKLAADETTIRYAEMSLDKQATNMLITQCNKAYHTEINDLLLSAFSLSLAKITGSDISYITLEGHGREEIVDNIDITRTVGWFTSMYPVRLEVVSENLGKTIISIKEQLRLIPNKGIGYGALFGYIKPELPRITFNYLGQLDQHVKEDNNYWAIAKENAGMSVNKDNADNAIINANGLIANGKLQFMIAGKLSENDLSKLVGDFQQKLSELILYLSEKKKVHYSINDFLYDFEEIYTVIDNSENNHDKETIFLLPPGDGGYESYLSSLVPYLTGKKLVLFNNYYLHIASKIDIRKEDNNIDFSFLAKFYIQFIKKIQPNGPYKLFGWSFGGVLSFEICRQLELAGDKISYLGLLDSFFDYKAVVDKLGFSDQSYLTNIHYKYTQDHYFHNSSKSQVILYKATRHTSAKEFNNVLNINDINVNKEIKLYDYYANSQCNFIDKYLDQNFLKIVDIASSHVNWMKNGDIIKNICEDLSKE